jgi:thiol-disulfide isomerase/thioredoxin
MQKVTDEAGLDAALGADKTIVLFHTTWCPFCRSFLPEFVRQTQAKPGVVEAVIDDEDNSLWEKYSIEIVPTVLFFEKGKVVRRLDGKPYVGLTAGDLAAAL